MTARDRIRAHPWLLWPTAALAIVFAAACAVHVRAGRRAELLARQRVILDEMAAIAAQCRRLARQADAADRLAPPGTLDIARIEELAKRRGLVRDIHRTLPPPRPSAGYVERAVDLSVSAVRREDLALFLRDVEALSPAIRARELRVTVNRALSPPEGGDLVDAKVQFSIYEREPDKGG